MARQNNLAILYENIADSADLSGGGWLSGSLGLNNLRTPFIAEVARSTDADPAHTQFRVALGSARRVGGVALGPCNTRPVARARIRAFFDAGYTQVIYDSGDISFPGAARASLELAWEDPGFWAGDAGEFDDLGKGVLFIHIPPRPVIARYWSVQIFDGGNPDGFLEIGRLFMGTIWQPAYNYSYDANELAFEALTDVEESRSGVRFYNPRNLRRTFTFGFPYLPDAETFNDVYRIATRSGQHGQVVVVPAPADRAAYQREAFLGTLGQMPSLRRPAFGMAATNFKIEETL